MDLLIETQHVVNNRKRVIISAGDSVHLQVVLRKIKAGNGNFKPHRGRFVSSADIYKYLRVIKPEVLQRVKSELEHVPCKKLYVNFNLGSEKAEASLLLPRNN